MNWSVGAGGHEGTASQLLVKGGVLSPVQLNYRRRGQVKKRGVHCTPAALPSGRGLAGSHPGRVQPLLDLLAPQLGGDVVSSTSTAQYLYSLKAVVSSSTKLAKFCLSS